jgi:hypothetical protein
MKEFRSAPKAVMSNARCLTEGVDVPAVDMVAFLSPKKSKVDIVQAIGRAMRRSGSKEVGYVLIPLYLEQKAGETLEEAVARANFEEVWDILQSLQEQDEVLAELIRDMAVAKGRGKIMGKGFDDSRFSDRIAFTGPVLALESIRQAVTTRVLERLESSWDVNFGKLVKFKEEHGHCRVSTIDLANQALGRWASDQRKYYSKGNLHPSHIARLNNLGFEWDPKNNDWESNYETIKAFRAEHGHCRVPAIFKINETLGRWVSTQRKSFLDKTLSHDRIAKLEAIGFEWDLLNTDWERNFDALKAFHAKHGHCRVPNRYHPRPRLGLWVGHQRSNYSKGRLLTDRVSRLEAIGFEWDLLKADWERNFDALKAFHAEHGHCRVPRRYKANNRLGIWVGTQRGLYTQKRLSSDRVTRLESLGFEWDPASKDWEKYFDDLKAFHAEHGHCRVPQKSKCHKELGRWVSSQRESYLRRKLCHDRIVKLESIGFEWDLLNADWELNFTALKKFHAEYGHCRIPHKSKTYKKLAIWVTNQRARYSKGNLTDDRIASFESLAMEWDYLNTEWERNFNALKEFRANHGHCRVPNRYKQNKRLGIWVSNQRARYSKGNLTPDRTARLEAIGFEWNPSSTDWERNFDALKSFRADHGHCRVPAIYEINETLGHWVSDQRKYYIKGKLSSDRILRLEAIGFEWNPSSTDWERNFDALKSFRADHGHCRVSTLDVANKKLGRWVSTQRIAYSKGKLPIERIAKLEALGFEWKVR